MALKQVPIRQDFSETVDYIIPQYPVYIRKGIPSSFHSQPPFFREWHKFPFISPHHPSFS